MRGVTGRGSPLELQQQFQLTRLMRGVTISPSNTLPAIWFQLTRLMRGVTIYGQAAFVYDEVSTHTPHARRDYHTETVTIAQGGFNSHASCEA